MEVAAPAAMSSAPLRVSVSVPGAFHAHRLAEQLHRHGALVELITSYPQLYMRLRSPVRIPSKHIRSTRLHPAMVALGRAGMMTPRFDRIARDLHDAMAARAPLEGLDFLVGWSGSSLRVIRAAKRVGARAVVVRGSSHIRVQQRLLAEEHASFGLPFAFDEASVVAELHEFEEADYIQTNSRFARDTMIAEGVAPERIILNNTGVDPILFAPIARNDDHFRVVCAGALSLRKGSYYLLRAFAELDLPGAELWHLGPVMPEVRRVARPFFTDKVKLFGVKPESALREYYSRGSVFLMPSIEEGLAVVQVQAMACGLPLICTPNSGGVDLLSGDGAEGFVVPIRDVDALKEKLLLLYQDRERCREMGRAARRRVLSNFTWDHYGDRMIAIYERLRGGGATDIDGAPRGENGHASPRPVAALQQKSGRARRRLRVAILTTGRFHVCDLARELSALGHEVAFYCAVPPWRTRRFGLPSRSNRWLGGWLAPLVLAERLATGTSAEPLATRAVNEALDELAARLLEPCDVFIGMSGMCTRTAEVARRRFGARVLVERASRHILSQREILEALPRLPGAPPPVADWTVQRELEAYQLADRIVVPSHHVLCSFLERGVPPERLFRNPLGVDLHMFPPTETPTNGAPCVLSVGTWSLRKGSDTLVAAWRRLRGVRLLHVGGVTNAILPREPGFEHHAAVDQRRLPAFYARGHVFALASREDGFGVVLAQALASGLPIVCSERTGGEDLAELLEDPRWVRVVPCEDVEALAGALDDALEQSRRLVGKRDILGHAREEVSWQAYARRYERALHELVS
jgi:glycosyltransferase involved in cell wall biosynthesis